MSGHYIEACLSSVLLNEEQIKTRVKELGQKISEDYEGRELTLVCVLSGSVIFFADLIRNITIPITLEFIKLSSYGTKARSSGTVEIKYDLESDIRGKNVLVVEDIIDTGHTLSRLVGLLKTREVNSVEVCCLLDKYERREVDVRLKYTGFVIPDEFVVGYGLDYASMYRNYGSIGVLKREVYEK